jgi:hypothetical protein
MGVALHAPAAAKLADVNRMCQDQGAGPPIPELRRSHGRGRKAGSGVGQKLVVSLGDRREILREPSRTESCRAQPGGGQGVAGSRSSLQQGQNRSYEPQSRGRRSGSKRGCPYPRAPIRYSLWGVRGSEYGKETSRARIPPGQGGWTTSCKSP